MFCTSIDTEHRLLCFWQVNGDTLCLHRGKSDTKTLDLSVLLVTDKCVLQRFITTLRAPVVWNTGCVFYFWQTNGLTLCSKSKERWYRTLLDLLLGADCVALCSIPCQGACWERSLSHSLFRIHWASEAPQTRKGLQPYLFCIRRVLKAQQTRRGLQPYLSRGWMTMNLMERLCRWVIRHFRSLTGNKSRFLRRDYARKDQFVEWYQRLLKLAFYWTKTVFENICIQISRFWKYDFYLHFSFLDGISLLYS